MGTLGAAGGDRTIWQFETHGFRRVSQSSTSFSLDVLPGLLLVLSLSYLQILLQHDRISVAIAMARWMCFSSSDWRLVQL
jgi:hypothetical protein